MQRNKHSSCLITEIENSTWKGWWKKIIQHGAVWLYDNDLEKTIDASIYMWKYYLEIEHRDQHNHCYHQ